MLRNKQNDIDMNSNNNIPQLRFPGFTGEWEETKLDDVCYVTDYVAAGSFADLRKNVVYQNKQDYAILVRVADKTYGFDPRKFVYINKHAYDFLKKSNLKPGDIVISNVGSCGFVFRCPDLGQPMSLAPNAILVRTDNNDFYYQLFNSKIGQSKINDIVSQSAMPKFNKTDFKSIVIPAPLPIEQQKIAECLSAMDDMISAQSEKVDALKEKKRGMMQQMFPQKGETTPRLRFPGFTGEWDYVDGDELFEAISNKNHNSDLPILALTQDQGAVPRDMINYNVIVSDKSVAGYKVVEVDDFIISLRSFQGGIEYSRYRGLCSPAYIVLRKKSKELCSDFYRIYFKSFNYIQDLNKNLEGIRDGKMISYKQFSEIKLPKPSPSEQQKIAECLSAMDDMIASESAKLEALKDHKKGLMQQLFPQPAK